MCGSRRCWGAGGATKLKSFHGSPSQGWERRRVGRHPVGVSFEASVPQPLTRGVVAVSQYLPRTVSFRGSGRRPTAHIFVGSTSHVFVREQGFPV